MFRARPGGAWHFCTNCPHWPDDYEEFDDDASRFSLETACKTCLRLDGTQTGDYDEPAYSISALALKKILS